MARNRTIVALGQGNEPEDARQDAAEPVTETASEESGGWEPDEEEVEEAPSRGFGWVLPALALLVVAGWTGFFAFARQSQILAGGTPVQWSDWITAWSVPVLLVLSLWLLAMRHSRREANRFGDVARAMSIESERLERRLAIVNRELSLAREFIAAQSRDLEALGRVASDRLSQNSERLAGLISENGERIDSIASVSTTALENMHRLRDELPVIANSARDVTNNIGNAGRTAQVQLRELVDGFARLNDFGQASERQVASLRERVDDAISQFEKQAGQLEEISRNRFAELGERSEHFRSDLEARESEAMAALRRRAETLTEEFSTARGVLEAAEERSLATLNERISVLAASGDKVSDDLRDAEKKAAAHWRAAIDDLQEQMQDAIEKIAEIDAAALASARKRLEALHADIAQADDTVAERSKLFAETIAQRRLDAQEREQELQRELEQKIAALDAQIFARHDAARRRSGEFADELDRKIAAIDAQIGERREEQLAHLAGLDERGEAFAMRIEQFSERILAASEQGQRAESQLASAIERLTAILDETKGTLDGTDQAVSGLTDASIRLLEIIRAGAEHSSKDLPAAIEIAEERLAQIEQRSNSLGLLMGETSEKGRELSDYVLSAQSSSRTALEQVEAMQTRIREHSDMQAVQVANLQEALASLAEASEGLSERAKGDLRDGIAELQIAAREVLEELGANSAASVQKLAETIGKESGEAVDRALRLRTAESIGQLEQAAAHASGVGREAAKQLRDQLAMVAELTDNLEARVTQARERAEEQVDNDFSRRMALITESLNSNAIDIAKVMSNDVSDTAWASYLRGDRGIFTRRAVRLIDSGEAKEIAEIYENDGEFREHVSRYIHDFEAMLRSMLSTRDGKALAVTLLSSDMGKLYVALAQAIERLRD